VVVEVEVGEEEEGDLEEVVSGSFQKEIHKEEGEELQELQEWQLEFQQHQEHQEQLQQEWWEGL